MKLYLIFALLPATVAFTRLSPLRIQRPHRLHAESISYPTVEKTIQVGDSIPEIPLKKAGEEEGRTSEFQTLLSSGKTVLVGVPGAFTPTCSENHVPGFIEAASSLEAENVTSLVILSVNDRFVMKAWDESLGLETLRAHSADASNGGLKPEVIADGRGTVAAALGLLVDKGDMGARCKRTALVIDEGKVAYVGIDEAGLDTSSAESVLQFLKEDREAKEKAAKEKAEAEAKAKADALAAAKAVEQGGDVDESQKKLAIGAVIVVALLGLVSQLIKV